MLLIALAACLVAEGLASPVPEALRDRIEREGSLPVWVFLADKGGAESDPEAMARARDLLTSRALARRSQRGGAAALPDSRDLPIHPGYLDWLKARGLRLRAQSRWLNAVSIELKSDQIDLLATAPFLRAIRPVARSVHPDPYPVEAVDASVHRRERDDPVDYGGTFAELDQINVPPVHATGNYAQGILIGLLDTGFETGHQAFGDLDVLASWDFINNDSIVGNEPGDPQTQAYHGTKVLSCLAGYDPGEHVGAAFGASFCLAKTEDISQEDPAEEDYWVAGIEWLEARGCDVVSSSLGYTDWYVFDDLDGNTAVTTIAADRAVELGVVVINSAGNHRIGLNHIVAPADGDSVIAVGAVDQMGTYAWFSSPGPTADGRIKPDVMARGVSNHIVDPASNDAYVTGIGTSYSAPLAAGVAALVLAYNPEATPMLVRDALRQTADHAESPDNDYGWGLLDAWQATRYFHPQINHEPLADSEDSLAVFSVAADIGTVQGEITEAFVHYRFDTGGWTSLPMAPAGSGYEAELPGPPWGTQIHYYISAANSLEMTSVHPVGAPDLWHAFAVGIDSLPPLIEHIPLTDLPQQNWPPLLEATVIDNLGLDRVYCQSSLNGVAQAEFDLEAVGATSYEANFPYAAQAGDTVSYMLIAVDQAGEPNTAFHPPAGNHQFLVLDVAGIVLLVDDEMPREGKAGRWSKDKVWMQAPPRVRSGRINSADIFEHALTEALYQVERVSLAEAQSVTWTNFDFVALACCDNLDPLHDDSFIEGLVDFVDSGGRLVIEGGEVAYDFQVNGPMMNSVLHCSGWLADTGGDLELADPFHPLVQGPDSLPLRMPLVFQNWGDQDIVTPLADADLVYETEYFPAQAGLIVYDDDLAPQAGQIVFMPFNLNALEDPETAWRLVTNAAAYLTADQPVGEGLISGNCALENEVDHSGISVALTGCADQITGPDGGFSFDSLWEGQYELQVTCPGFLHADTTFFLPDGGQVTDLFFEMQAVDIYEGASAPELPIPDNYPAGVLDSLHVPVGGELLDLEVDLDISHTYIGDLKVILISPQGSSVMLHDRSGGSNDDISGTYPIDLIPAENLDNLFGENVNGIWQLHVADLFGWDVGFLHSWGLRLTVPAQPTDLPATPPGFGLVGNHPNPFNPATEIRFSLDRNGSARLGIYDLRGRLVRLLVDDSLAAGEHSVLWHGRDAGGRLQASGLYFARLQSAGRSSVRKMILIK